MNQKHVDAYLDVASFLLWLQKEKPYEMWGAVKIGKAIAGLSTLTGIPTDQAEKIIFQHDNAS